MWEITQCTEQDTLVVNLPTPQHSQPAREHLRSTTERRSVSRSSDPHTTAQEGRTARRFYANRFRAILPNAGLLDVHVARAQNFASTTGVKLEVMTERCGHFVFDDSRWVAPTLVRGLTLAAWEACNRF